MGEGLPFYYWRFGEELARITRSRLHKSVQQYFHDNLWVTTSMDGSKPASMTSWSYWPLLGAHRGAWHPPTLIPDRKNTTTFLDETVGSPLGVPPVRRSGGQGRRRLGRALCRRHAAGRADAGGHARRAGVDRHGPGRTWHRACQAMRLLATAARLLVDSVPAGVRRDEVVNMAVEAIVLLGATDRYGQAFGAGHGAVRSARRHARGSIPTATGCGRRCRRWRNGCATPSSDWPARRPRPGRTPATSRAGCR